MVQDVPDNQEGTREVLEQPGAVVSSLVVSI
jgi:hypothetical protein